MAAVQQKLFELGTCQVTKILLVFLSATLNDDRHFPKCQLPKFAISRVETPQVLPYRNARPFTCSSYRAPLVHPSRSALPPL